MASLPPANAFDRTISLLKDLFLGGLLGNYCEEIEPSANLKGRVAIVTGATAGIGLETSRALAWRGAHVILAGRDKERLANAANNIREHKPKQALPLTVQAAADLKLTQLIIDLASLDSVRNFAKAFLALNLPLHFLINNAGVMMSPLSLVTVEGLDGQMGSNHLAHYYLTKLLLNKLTESGTARIVCLSSSAHFSGNFSADDIKQKFYPIVLSPYQVYGNSKLCNVLHAKELSRRLQGTQVTAYSVHPGAVKTELGRHLGLKTLMLSLVRWMFKNVDQGSSTTLYTCLTPGLESLSGEYFANCAQAKTNKLAHDPQISLALWEASEDYIKLFENGQLNSKKSN